MQHIFKFGKSRLNIKIRWYKVHKDKLNHKSITGHPYNADAECAGHPDIGQINREPDCTKCQFQWSYSKEEYDSECYGYFKEATNESKLH